MINVGVRRPGYVASTYQVENVTPTFKSDQLENSEQSKEKIIKWGNPTVGSLPPEPACAACRTVMAPIYDSQLRSIPSTGILTHKSSYSSPWAGGVWIWDRVFRDAHSCLFLLHGKRAEIVPIAQPHLQGLSSSVFLAAHMTFELNEEKLSSKVRYMAKQGSWRGTGNKAINSFSITYTVTSTNCASVSDDREARAKCTTPNWSVVCSTCYDNNTSNNDYAHII